MNINDELAWTPAHRLRELIRARKVSPVELTELALRRIETHNARVNAFLTVIPEQAMDSARTAERAVMRGDPLGPLHGIPISIKDLEGVKGVRQTNGCLVYKDFVSPADSLTTERLRKAGAIIVGKTNTSEFGHIGTNENRLGDACRNPWNTECTSGASSGGAGSSVAAGLTAIAQGSDGGGSIRIPSGFCGIYGIKPSQGRVPRRDMGIDSWHPVNFSNVGPMTRDVRDAALMLQVLAGPASDAEPGTIDTAPPNCVAALDRGVKGLRIGWSRDLGGVPVDPEVADIAGKAARVFEELGAIVEAPEFKIDEPQSVFDHFQVIYRTRAYAVNGHLLREHRELLTDYLIEGLERGREMTGEQLWDAYSMLNRYRAYVRKYFETYDLLLTPTLAVPAFPINKHPETIGGMKVPHRLWGFTPFTYPFNMAMTPAASVPCGFSDGGLPIGLHIIGRFGDEETVLAASAAFEESRPWAQRRPKGF
ncbi:MAG: amidase [Chloroflexi bacterium]|nr:amidase [Chloroflexota bacterium]